MTWSVRRLCSSRRFCTSRAQICDPTNRRWVAVKYPQISQRIKPVCTATQRISFRSQIRFWEVNERPGLHNLAYWSFHDTMRTQMLNWTHSRKNSKFITAVWSWPSWNTVGICQVRVMNPPIEHGSGFSQGNELNWTELQASYCTARGFPHLLLTLVKWC